MEWINPLEELPKDGVYVACMRYHWKNCWPLSAEIMFGEVESYINEAGDRIARVNTNDFTGSGSSYWSFPCCGFMPDSEKICAWMLAKNFKKPEFLHHNYHWGEER